MTFVPSGYGDLSGMPLASLSIDGFDSVMVAFCLLGVFSHFRFCLMYSQSNNY